MQPNVPHEMPAQQKPANAYAPQDHHIADEKMQSCVPGNVAPAFPAQQMHANTVAAQDVHSHEKEKKKKKHRLRRFVKGYLLLAGVLVTFFAIVYAIIVLLETFSPLT